MTKIKLCGLTRMEDIEAVNRWEPDYAGFVFAKSRRQVTRDQASFLKQHLSKRIKAVGVFVNEEMEVICSLYKEQVIDIVQLHGDESKQYAEKLKKECGCKIIKAIRVRDNESILKAEDFPCDFLLFDTWKDGTYGGSGETFHWEWIKGRKKPFFLAGGLNASNLGQAIQMCHPYGVDLSGGIETDGKKDKNKMEEIVRIVRS